MSAHTLGPVETLARLAIQSNQYVKDEEFRSAVDAVIGKPVFDAAPDLLKALNTVSSSCPDDIGDMDGAVLVALTVEEVKALRAAIAKAEGGAA